MNRPTKHQYWIELLSGVSKRGTCPRRQTAAIIVDEDNLILASGYNGPPKKLSNCIETPCAGVSDEPGNTDRCLAIHAEDNAIKQLRERFYRAEIIYCTNLPCFNCAKDILSTPIKTVVYIEDYADKRGLDILLSAGIEVIKGEYDEKDSK